MTMPSEDEEESKEGGVGRKSYTAGGINESFEQGMGLHEDESSSSGSLFESSSPSFSNHYYQGDKGN